MIDENNKNLGYKIINRSNKLTMKTLALTQTGRKKKTAEDLNENDTYNKRSNSQLFSHSRIGFL